MKLRQTSIFSDINYFAKQSCELETRVNFTGFWNIFQNGATLLLIFIQNYERLEEEFEIHDNVIIQPGIYRYNNFYSEFESDKSKPISGKISLNAGNFYDGDILGYGLETNLKLGSRLTMNLLYNHNNVKIKAGHFRTHIVGSRILYTFSPKLFAKAFIQWYSDDDNIVGNFLVHFIHTPGSDLFFVFNEELDTTKNKLSTTNRVILMKLNYLFNF